MSRLLIPSLPRRYRRWLAAIMAVLLCSAHLAAVAHTCVLPVAAGPTPMLHPCGDPLGLSEPQAANLCAEHCKVGNQSDQVRVPGAAPVMMLALYPARLPAVDAGASRPISPPDARVPIAPPHAIAHCVLRI